MPRFSTRSSRCPSRRKRMDRTRIETRQARHRRLSRSRHRKFEQLRQSLVGQLTDSEPVSLAWTCHPRGVLDPLLASRSRTIHQSRSEASQRLIRPWLPLSLHDRLRTRIQAMRSLPVTPADRPRLLRRLKCLLDRSFQLQPPLPRAHILPPTRIATRPGGRSTRSECCELAMGLRRAPGGNTCAKDALLHDVFSASTVASERRVRQRTQERTALVPFSYYIPATVLYRTEGYRRLQCRSACMRNIGKLRRKLGAIGGTRVGTKLGGLLIKRLSARQCRS